MPTGTSDNGCGPVVFDDPGAMPLVFVLDLHSAHHNASVVPFNTILLRFMIAAGTPQS
jgi:hypothetical protein